MKTIQLSALELPLKLNHNEHLEDCGGVKEIMDFIGTVHNITGEEIEDIMWELERSKNAAGYFYAKFDEGTGVINAYTAHLDFRHIIKNHDDAEEKIKRVNLAAKAQEETRALAYFNQLSRLEGAIKTHDGKKIEMKYLDDETVAHVGPIYAMKRNKIDPYRTIKEMTEAVAGKNAIPNEAMVTALDLYGEIDKIKKECETK